MTTDPLQIHLLDQATGAARLLAAMVASYHRELLAQDLERDDALELAIAYQDVLLSRTASSPENLTDP